MKKALFLFLFIVSAACVDVSAQCPMCKTALKSNQSNKEAVSNSYGKGINKGILFLMAFPYIMGSIGLVVYVKYRKRQKLSHINRQGLS